MTIKEQEYQGFEHGPIRPPSEAASLLIRVTRNCPWNRCTFCPVYKGSLFSLRPVAHVLKDIDAVYRYVMELTDGGRGPGVSRSQLNRIANDVPAMEEQAFHAALHWIRTGMTSIFLQDANSLILPPEDLITVLQYLREKFPWVERVTSYARSHTIARIRQEHLDTMAKSGLNRIHIGMESGSDKVLANVKKGVDKATHILAGQKVKAAGMSLSEYVMPGLGGVKLSREHALETADALNRIDPDFIRLRTLAIPNHVELFQSWESGAFDKCDDLTMAHEIRTLIAALDGITSTLTSDHILNLFEEINGRFPDDKADMLEVVDRFLAMPREEQMVYQVGRRIGLFRGLDDMSDPMAADRARSACSQMGVTPENVDGMIDELMKRFI